MNYGLGTVSAGGDEISAFSERSLLAAFSASRQESCGLVLSSACRNADLNPLGQHQEFLAYLRGHD